MERPDFSHMSCEDIAAMLVACGLSNDPSDREFAKFCADELKKRKSTSPTVAKERAK